MKIVQIPGKNRAGTRSACYIFVACAAFWPNNVVGLLAAQAAAVAAALGSPVRRTRASSRSTRRGRTRPAMLSIMSTIALVPTRLSLVARTRRSDRRGTSARSSLVSRAAAVAWRSESRHGPRNASRERRESAASRRLTCRRGTTRRCKWHGLRRYDRRSAGRSKTSRSTARAAANCGPRAASRRPTSEVRERDSRRRRAARQSRRAARCASSARAGVAASEQTIVVPR